MRCTSNGPYKASDRFSVASVSAFQTQIEETCLLSNRNCEYSTSNLPPTFLIPMETRQCHPTPQCASQNSPNLWQPLVTEKSTKKKLKRQAIKPFYKHMVIHWTKDSVSCEQVAKKQLYACTRLIIVHKSSSTRSHFQSLIILPKMNKLHMWGGKERKNTLGTSDGMRIASNCMIKKK